MVGLVIVSHSHKLAEGVCEVARQMADDAVRIASVGGIPEPGKDELCAWALGTDAVAIARAIEATMTDAGVLVLIDLGSAGFSAEEALQLLPDGLQERTLISNAPLVEGAVVAAVEASLGRDLHTVNRAAEEAGKASKL